MRYSENFQGLFSCQTQVAVIDALTFGMIAGENFAKMQ